MTHSATPLGANIGWLRSKSHYHLQEMDRASRGWKERIADIERVAEAMDWDEEKTRIRCREDLTLGDLTAARRAHGELLSGYAAMMQAEIAYQSYLASAVPNHGDLDGED